MSDNGFCWLGNDGWLVRLGGNLIATDLDLFSRERLLPTWEKTPELAEKLEFLLVSHAHGDHFHPETAAYLARNGPCRFILPYSCADAAKTYGIPDGRIVFAEPGFPIQPAQWLRLSPYRALHGHLQGSVYREANLQDCGYLIEAEGLRVFQPGDTVLLEEHLLLEDIDVLFVSPTEHNMWIDASVRFIQAVRPALAVAQHFGTYRVTQDNAFWTQGYPHEVKQRLSSELEARFLIPEYGKWYSF